jgi:DNA (cytosine-5)-methyltransferase 1
MSVRIPVVDLFAGPGGLGEGFSRHLSQNGAIFRSVLAAEKEASAHSTLLLRSFFRKFQTPPPQYVSRLRGDISTEELFSMFPREARAAREEAWHVELGSPEVPVSAARDKFSAAIGRTNDWVLLGGPPCQAYSIAGRSRNRGVNGYSFEADKKSTLYLEYLQLIADFWPAVFIMENVKGLLSARMHGSSMIERIIDDLTDPVSTISREGRTRARMDQRHRYDVYSATGVDDQALAGLLVKTEEYGIPQARHRVILIGVRRDFSTRRPPPLKRADQAVSVRAAIGDLPKIRSRLSRDDSSTNWANAVGSILSRQWDLPLSAVQPDVVSRMYDIAERASDLAFRLRTEAGRSARPKPKFASDWYQSAEAQFVTHHDARGHMALDLIRYLFVSSFAEQTGRSPRLSDFPRCLLPQHKNVAKANATGHFSDRFRAQIWNTPSTTITSHINRDGHYYIHPDPSQCRSLTVREAARLQTFPDTYIFEGTRTQQYIQVGNAVPPLLAYQLAHCVAQLF